MKKVKLGLIGKDVSKSQSGKIHQFILEKLGFLCEYSLFSLKKEALESEIARLLKEFDGFNVTIPFKADVVEYLDGIFGDAIMFNSVNTIVCRTRKGYNTDGVGFMQMLQTAGVDVKDKKVLVLGAGGAGRSTALSLKQAGARISLYRRNREELIKTCEALGVTAAVEPEKGGYDIVINATGVGMHDTVGQSPVGEGVFLGAYLAVDLIYRPSESEFLRLAKGAGLRVLNGQAMLFYQAYYSDCYYLGKEPDSLEAERFYMEYCKNEA